MEIDDVAPILDFWLEVISYEIFIEFRDIEVRVPGFVQMFLGDSFPDVDMRVGIGPKRGV